MIISDDNSTTIILSINELTVLCNNLHKILLVNTPITNDHSLYVLMVSVLGIKHTQLITFRSYDITLSFWLTLDLFMLLDLLRLSYIIFYVTSPNRKMAKLTDRGGGVSTLDMLLVTEYEEIFTQFGSL